MLTYLLDSLNELFKRPTQNLSSLDGLRSMAIIFVVCMHVNDLILGNNGYSQTLLSQLPPFKGGWMGVPMFFVLSGFLIGGQLWKELSIKEDINIRKFILRRGLRIWPLYYVVMLTIYIFSISNDYQFDSMLINTFFLGNYLKDTGPIFGSWSLATEEQFYIIAPLFLVGIYKIYPNKDLKGYRKILIFIFFLPLILRYFTWDIILGLKDFNFKEYMSYIYRPFHTNSEGLVAGLLLSNYYHDPESFFHKPITKSFYFCLLLATFTFAVSFYSKIYFNFTGIAIGFSALLIYCLKTKGIINRIFSLDILYIVSKTSFAIYLIHIHVIKNLVPQTLVKKLSMGIIHLEIIIVLLIVMIISIFISVFLYIFIERPFIKMRSRLLDNF